VGATETAALDHLEVGSVVLFWLFAILIQVCTNLHNDYADFVKGADTAERKGSARATQKGWLTPRQVAGAAIMSACAAAAVGVCIILTSCPSRFSVGFMTFVLMTSLFNAFAYTGGKFPLGMLGLGWVSLGYAGLGDLFVFLYFGLVATVAPWVLSVGTLPPVNIRISAAVVGLHAVAILVVNNLRDVEQDNKAGKKTLAVRLGRSFTRWEYTVCLLLPFLLSIVILFIQPLLPEGVPQSIFVCSDSPELCLLSQVLPLFSLPLAVSHVWAIWFSEGESLDEYVGRTAQFQLIYGLLVAAGAGLRLFFG